MKREAPAPLSISRFLQSYHYLTENFTFQQIFLAHKSFWNKKGHVGVVKVCQCFVQLTKKCVLLLHSLSHDWTNSTCTANIATAGIPQYSCHHQPYKKNQSKTKAPPS